MESFFKTFFKSFKAGLADGTVGRTYFTNADAEKGKVLGRSEPDEETVEQTLAYKAALARRPDWNHPIAAAVVEVCGNTGYNWFDLP